MHSKLNSLFTIALPLLTLCLTIGGAHSNTPDPFTVQLDPESWKIRSPQSAEDQLEQEFALELLRNVARYGSLDLVGRGDCPLEEEELDSVLGAVAEKYDKFENGLELSDVLTALKGSTWDCNKETLGKLHSAHEKFSNGRQTTRARHCVKSYIDQNFFEYLAMCYRTKEREFVDKLKRELGIKRDSAGAAVVDSFDNTIGRDVNYADAELSKKLNEISENDCHERPDKVLAVLKAVDDKTNTWLSGYNVKTILSVTKHYLWNCDLNRLAQHSEARRAYERALISVSRCMSKFYETVFNSLISYCQKLLYNNAYPPYSGQQYLIADERAKQLNEILPNALAKLDKSRTAVEEFARAIATTNFMNVNYQELLRRGEREYLRSSKGVFAPSKEKRLRALQAHCKNIIKALESIHFMNLYAHRMADEHQHLDILMRAHQMCHLFVQVDLDARFANKEPRSSSCLKSCFSS